MDSTSHDRLSRLMDKAAKFKDYIDGAIEGLGASSAGTEDDNVAAVEARIEAPKLTR